MMYTIDKIKVGETYFYKHLDGTEELVLITRKDFATPYGFYLTGEYAGRRGPNGDTLEWAFIATDIIIPKEETA